MARTYGALAQSAPSAVTLTALSAVPSAKHWTAKVIVCNRSTADSFRIAISPAGAAIDNKHYIAYDQAISGNDSVCSVSFTAAATDVVRVYSTNGTLSFTVDGIEDDD